MTQDTAGEPTSGIVPQRLLLVLSSTGEFDSRTYRIASSALARGHEVTVIARWRAGLPQRETHPSGYAIIRVQTDAGDALPGRPLARRLVRARARTPSTAAAAAMGGGSDGGASDALARSPGAIAAPTAEPPPRRNTPIKLIRRIAHRVIQRWVILLTARSHALRARDVAPPVDLVHGMAYMGIPVALRIADSQRPRPKVVYDARDIYLQAANLARMRGPVRWAIDAAERLWARRADRVITVNQPYADVMTRRFGVATPLVVMNCSYRFTPADPPEQRFHERLGLSSSTRVVLYHGGFSRDRGIEQLFEAIKQIDDAMLVLMGYGIEERTYRERADLPDVRERVRIIPAVPPAELLSWVASADVVAMPIQPTTLNHQLTTPNKLFEAMAAGVPVVASDLPGMAQIVTDARCGLLVDPTDPAAIAAACREILDASPEEAAAWRRRALTAAHDRFNWEGQAELLFAEYGRLTGRPW